MNILDIKYIKYIIIFLPFSFAIGRFTTDLNIVIIGIFFICYSIYNKIKIDYLNFFILLILFYIYIVVRSLVSEDPVYSLHSSLFYFRFILYAYGIYLLLLLFNKKFVLNLFFSFLIIYAFLILDSYLQYYTGQNIISIPYDGTRITSIFEEKILGSYIVRTMPIFIFTYLYLSTLNDLSNKYLRIIFFIILILLDTIVLLSGERTAFALLIIFNVLILFISSNQLQKIFLLKSLISFSVIIVFLSLSSNVKNRIYDETVTSISKEGNYYIFSQEYDSIFKSSVEVFKSNPLFGHGTRMYNKICNKQNIEMCGSHSHNSYLQLLSETGIIGFSFLFIFFIYIVFQLFILFKQRYFGYNINNFHDLKTVVLLLIFINFFPISSNGNFFGNWISALYFLPIGFYLFTLKSDEKFN